MLDARPCSTEPPGEKAFGLKDAAKGENGFCLSIPGAVDSQSHYSSRPCKSLEETRQDEREASLEVVAEEASLDILAEENIVSLRSASKESAGSEGSYSIEICAINSVSSRERASQDERRNQRRGSKGSAVSVESIRSAASRTSQTAREIATYAKEHMKVDPFHCTVVTAGAILALCAGMVNAIAFLELGTFVSHVTGSTAKAGLHADDGAQVEARECAMLVVSFVLGSMVCGCLIKKDVVSFGAARYGYALIGNGCLLLLATLTSRDEVAPYLASAACGLQNGMATSYSGAVIRTTHVTGIATDVGLIIGRLVTRCFGNICHSLCPGRGMTADAGSIKDDLKKLALLVLLGVSFLAGILCGARLRRAFGQDAFLVPAIIALLAGVVYSIYRCTVSRRGKLSWSGAAASSALKTDPVRSEQPKEEVRAIASQTSPASCDQADSAKWAAPRKSPSPRTLISELLEHMEGLRPLLAAALPPQSGRNDADSAQAEAMRAYESLKELTLKALGQPRYVS
mmetsp:Transcript_13312/g.23078  ORF Transcript_13312/g.23078 Transcript_13312/m.23078 type:complete len:515 (+) Transcript_13312:107-1651(+)